jgi:hypothetical protein
MSTLHPASSSKNGSGTADYHILSSRIPDRTGYGSYARECRTPNGRSDGSPGPGLAEKVVLGVFHTSSGVHEFRPLVL